MFWLLTAKKKQNLESAISAEFIFGKPVKFGQTGFLCAGQAWQVSRTHFLE
jgi:hypothetical protein